MSDKKNFVAIAGNPNSGKTTAFNWYTGARQHVGNYPGITVDQKLGTAHLNGKSIHLVDLPGTYSLTAYSMEEVVARKVLAEDRPGVVLDIVNAAVLERNLYLTVQLLEMGVPVVIALNMIDEAKEQGMSIDIARFEALTGVKAVTTVARTGEGLKDALAIAVQCAEEKAGQPWKPLEISYGTDIDAVLAELVPLIEQHKLLTHKYPARWVALKFLENDSDIQNQASSEASEALEPIRQLIEKLNKHLSVTRNSYAEAVIAEYRYGYISSLLRDGVLTSENALQNRIASSDKLDEFLTHKFFGPLVLACLLYFMYVLTFVVGAIPQGWVEDGFALLHELADANMADGLLKSMVISGVIDGVGGVFGFVPLIMVMFFFIAFLEDSGYMARVAYMMDRVFRFFGLHGASVMPFIISGGIAGGCAVPGVMAARTLRSPKERLATILTAPFMSCGAKLPVLILFISIFFKENRALIMLLLTLFGWLIALVVARILRSTLIRGEATPFVMELPPYRMPTLVGTLIHMWERAWMYIKKAGTIILAISIIIWAGMTFPNLTEEEGQPFTIKKEALEEKLAEYPMGKLTKKIDELSEELGKLDVKDPKYEEMGKKIASLTEELNALPIKKLEEEIAGIKEWYEGLEGADVAEAQANELTALEEKIAAEAGEAEPKTLLVAAEKIRETMAATAAGKAKLELIGLNHALDALPEKAVLDDIATLANEQSALALKNSYAGRIGTFLEPASKLAGFDWKTNIALVAGIAAKEVVVSTLGTAYSLGEVDAEGDQNLTDRIATDPSWTMANGIGMLLFTMLYSPCFVTVVMIKQETGKWRWALFTVFFNLGLAYLVAVIVYQLLKAV